MKKLLAVAAAAAAGILAVKKWQENRQGTCPLLDIEWTQERLRTKLRLAVIKKLGELGYGDIFESPSHKGPLNNYYLENCKEAESRADGEGK